MFQVVPQVVSILARSMLGRFSPDLPPKPVKIRVGVGYTCTSESIQVSWVEHTVELWTMKDGRLQWFWEKVLRHQRMVAIQAGSKQFTQLPSSTMQFLALSVDGRTGLIECAISTTDPGFLTYPYAKSLAVCTAASGGSGGGWGVVDASMRWL